MESDAARCRWRHHTVSDTYHVATHWAASGYEGMMWEGLVTVYFAFSLNDFSLI